MPPTEKAQTAKNQPHQSTAQMGHVRNIWGKSQGEGFFQYKR